METFALGWVCTAVYFALFRSGLCRTRTMIRQAMAIALLGVGIPGYRQKDPSTRRKGRLETRDRSQPRSARKSRTARLSRRFERLPLAGGLLALDRSHNAWERTEWGRMAAFSMRSLLFSAVSLYWDMAAWHMAWNASAAALQDTAQPSEALRDSQSTTIFSSGTQLPQTRYPE